MNNADNVNFSNHAERFLNLKNLEKSGFLEKEDANDIYSQFTPLVLYIYKRLDSDDRIFIFKDNSFIISTEQLAAVDNDFFDPLLLKSYCAEYPEISKIVFEMLNVL
jgi:hypothetical protein